MDEQICEVERRVEREGEREGGIEDINSLSPKIQWRYWGALAVDLSPTKSEEGGGGA